MSISLLFCLIGGLLGFANPWFHFPPALILIPFSISSISFKAACPSHAFFKGWLGAIFAIYPIIYWTALPTHQYGGLNWIVALLCPLALALLLALYFAVYALFMHLGQYKLSPFLLIVSSAFFWTTAEHLSSLLFSGFPWTALSSGLVDWVFAAQGASLVGAYGLSGIVTACAVSLLLIHKSKVAPLSLLGIVFFLASYAYWAIYHTNIPDAPQLTLALVQGNVDQAVKWDQKFRNKTVNTYTKLTNSVLAQNNIDLAIWPETAMPFYLHERSISRNKILEYLQQTKLSLITGTPGYVQDDSPRTTSLRNRAILFNSVAQNEQYYDKEHLVPFGEYMPLPDWLSLDKLTQGIGDYTAGQNQPPFHFKGVNIGLLICYEIVFPDLMQKRVENKADILVNISNDAWFGHSSAPYQHLAHARLRAIEQRRPIARCTNNGITAFIDPFGRITAKAPQFTATTLTQTLKPVAIQSFYHTTYHWQLRLLYIITGLFVLWNCFSRPKKTYTYRKHI